ncbi:hypothetical protein QFZ28_003241 [Neobacillus niacini]|uniref:hypothetical protein n=1 Tax=Neobacillus niacini TaxID=86668 RepID=UPI00278B421C|nr:hypothetical protein [Neobacillus niacini]MDQ1002841.1 hypothetical protein [Neobacillus niacini]
MLIIPWLTVPFIRKQSFFRFLPVASFTSLFLTVFSAMANKKKWWITKRPLFSGIPVDFPYILGPYFVGTLWVFKQTYGNLPKYLLTNIVLGIINVGPFFFISQKVVGVFKFKRMNNITWYFISLFTAILIYGVQYNGKIN